MMPDRRALGFNRKRPLRALPGEAYELHGFIVNPLHSGAAMYNVIGAYQRTPRKEWLMMGNMEGAGAHGDIQKTDPSMPAAAYGGRRRAASARAPSGENHQRTRVAST